MHLCVLRMERRGAHCLALLSYIVFFLIVLSIVGCVAWSRDRSHQSGTHDAQTGRRRGANTARVSTRRHPRRQHSGRSVSPPPPYLPPAPSYTSLPFAPLCNGRQYDEEPGLDIQMTAAGGERSLPSLPLSRASSRVSPTGRLSAPGTAADLQPPPEAHVARHGLE